MLNNLFNWSTTTKRSEWTTWKEWERTQPASHYKSSDLYIYYLSHRTKFKVPNNSVISTEACKYYSYCFGDYISFIMVPYGESNVVEYFALLLDFYDTCKGISRRLTGDPTGITILRQTVMKKTLTPLFEHDLEQYSYDYTEIHAHTVAQFSLSTLIMLLASNYVSRVCSKQYFPSINAKLCQKAYDKCTFGSITQERMQSKAIDIPSKSVGIESKVASWPRNDKLLRCSKCSRVSDTVWGLFDCCLDCHLKRICSICSATAVIITSDDLPKCAQHSHN